MPPARKNMTASEGRGVSMNVLGSRSADQSEAGHGKTYL